MILLIKKAALLFQHWINEPQAYTQQSAWLPTRDHNIPQASHCSWRNAQWLGSLLPVNILASANIYC